ncbi:MAG: YIP1 family protein [Woeseiaceae bacterium]|nr:YIP1 family protein [Woeseiaceae bacterium]
MDSSSPLRSIWFHPAETIAHVAHENPGYRLFVLPIAAGLLTLPTVALFGDKDLEFTIGFAWASLVAFGPIAEILQVFVGAYLIRLTGAWLGGKAGSTSLQTAIVWGNVPIVAMTLLGIVAVVFSFVYNEFSTEPLVWGQSPVVLAVGWTLIVVQTALIAWSLAIFLKGVAVVQGFSMGRALLNALLAWSLAAAVLALATVVLGLSEHLNWLFFGGIGELVGIHASE